MLGYLSADITCSEKRTVFRERSSRETVSFEEQIMSKDKYPSIFSPQMVTIVFIILQIFFATRAILKIGDYSRIFPSFSWRIFGHVTRLDQSRASGKIWWIITSDSRPRAFYLTIIPWARFGYEIKIRELKHARLWDADCNRKRMFSVLGPYCLPDF